LVQKSKLRKDRASEAGGQSLSRLRQDLWLAWEGCSVKIITGKNLLLCYLYTFLTSVFPSV